MTIVGRLFYNGKQAGHVLQLTPKYPPREHPILKQKKTNSKRVCAFCKSGKNATAHMDTKKPGRHGPGVGVSVMTTGF
jgi:hypothetical protein